MLPSAVGGSAALNFLGAGSAAGKQQAGAEKAARATSDAAAQSRADLSPYRVAGQSALSRLQKLLGISGGVDENDPRFKAIYNPLVQDFDNLHRARYGIGIYDNGVDVASREAGLQRLKDQASQQYQTLYGSGSAGGGGAPDDSLLRKFTTADLEADPVYQNGLKFGLDEGTKAIERRASSAGGYDSGATLKALTRFGTDYGSQKAGEAYSRFTNDQDRTFGKLTGIAGMGSGATNVGVGASTTAGTNLAGLYSGLGNAQGAATIAGTNAISNGLNNYMQYNLLSQLTPGGQRSLQGYDPGANDTSRLYRNAA